MAALDHLHQRKLAHLDLKEANVMMDTALNVKLIDFGTTSLFGTKHHLVMGYMAPELNSGTEDISAKTDSWGVGLIMHQLYNYGDWNVLLSNGKAYNGSRP